MTRKLRQAIRYGWIAMIATAAACGKEEPGQARIRGILFSTSQTVIPAGGTARLPLKTESSAGTADYDFATNTLQLSLASDNPSVVAVNAAGEARALKVGSADVTASSSDGELSARMQVIVSFDFSRPLEPSQIYAKGMLLHDKMAMQSFDLARNGDLIVAGCQGPALHVQRCPRSGVASEPMTIYYAGHGTNISIEEQAGEIHVWTSNFATRYADGSYFGEQIVSRVKFESGRSCLAEECTDHYYVGPYRNLCVAVNAADDLLCILCGDNVVPGKNTRFDIYRLSEAKAVPVSEVTLLEISRGGESSAPTPAQKIRPRVAVHDLTKIAPLYRFYADNAQLNGGMPMQGYCIARDRIYWCAGDGGRNDDGATPPSSTLTELDLHGRIIRLHTPVAASRDVGRLDACGLTDPGYFEAEGVKIRNGRCYLGFITTARQDSWEFRAHVLRLE